MGRSFSKIIIVFLIAIACSSDGYVGELPKLNLPPDNPVISPKEKVDTPSQKPKESKKLTPLAPKTFPDIYAGRVIKGGKYSQYLLDLEVIVPYLKSMREIIDNKEEFTLQLFCAKANVLYLYANDFKSKYANKPEKNYRTYKQILLIDKQLNELAEFWRYTSKDRQFKRGSLYYVLTDKAIIKKKAQQLASIIDTTLQTIKENHLE